MNSVLRIKGKNDPFCWQKGFTMIELMISIFIVISIGTIVFSIFATTLRGSKKSVTITRVRENGNFAISQMARNIQYAQITSTCDSTESTRIDLEDPDGNAFTYSCTPSTDADPNNIASSSGSKKSLLVDTTFTKVVTDSCSFTCIDNGTFSPKQIKIRFTLEDVSTSKFAEDQVFIPFSTSVSLRNYSR